MKKIIILGLFSLLAVTNIQAQDPVRRTYPVDSCLYFMDPYQFRVQSVFDLPNNSSGAVTIFRSSGSPDLFINGRGRFAWINDSLPTGVNINPETVGDLLLSVPEPPEGSENWPGGVPPFPLFLYGFIEKIGQNTIDPPIPITLQVAQLFFEDTTE